MVAGRYLGVISLKFEDRGESHRVGKLKIEAAAKGRDNEKRKVLHLELEKDKLICGFCV